MRVNADKKGATTQQNQRTEKNDRISEKMTKNDKHGRRLRINTFVSLKSIPEFTWRLRA
jgi:hypothetical protein